MITAAPEAQLENDLRAAAARALRRRASLLRKAAADGVTVLDASPVVLIVKSDSAKKFQVARQWDRIAEALENEASS
jgi:hypothetical protein